MRNKELPPELEDDDPDELIAEATEPVAILL